MKARHPGTCSVCGCPIRVGQEIVTTRCCRMGRRSTRHAVCPHNAYQQQKAEEIREVVDGPKKRED